MKYILFYRNNYIILGYKFITTISDTVCERVRSSLSDDQIRLIVSKLYSKGYTVDFNLGIINVASRRRPDDYPIIDVFGFEYFASLGCIAMVPLSYPYEYYIDLPNPNAEPELTPYISEIKKIILSV